MVLNEGTLDQNIRMKTNTRETKRERERPSERAHARVGVRVRKRASKCEIGRRACTDGVYCPVCANFIAADSF